MVSSYEKINFQSLLGFIIGNHSITCNCFILAFNPFWDLSLQNFVQTAIPVVSLSIPFGIYQKKKLYHRDKSQIIFQSLLGFITK